MQNEFDQGRRIYQPGPIKLATLMSLDEKASHHLATVLRAKVGEPVTLFNGEGGEYAAVIRQIAKKSISLEVLAFQAREAESPLQLQLAQGVARGEKMDFIVQKAVELGVSCIVPLLTERSNVRLDAERAEKKRQHWQAVVVSACEQSGRNRIPIVQPIISLIDWLPQVQAARRLILSPQGEAALEPLSIDASAVLLVGPEGGLSQKEESLARQQGFASLQLGPRILRTETAALAALAVLQARFGDFLPKTVKSS